MTFSEKVLYHQIHPLKLGTDVTASLVSLYFLWQHWLVIGLVTHFLPPVVASALVISFSGLERQKHSRFGNYVGRMMTRPVEAVRLFGDIVTVFGAWYQSIALIAFGFLIVIAAWLSGFFPGLSSPRTGR